jgi:hypothetical protein
MNPQWLLRYFEQVTEAPDVLAHQWCFYLEYQNHPVQKSQMPSGKSQGSSPVSTSEHAFNISQTSSAKLAAAFSMKKRLMEWAEAALQNGSGGR